MDTKKQKKYNGFLNTNKINLLKCTYLINKTYCKGIIYRMYTFYTYVIDIIECQVQIMDCQLTLSRIFTVVKIKSLIEKYKKLNGGNY